MQWESKNSYRHPFKADVADNAILRKEMLANPKLEQEANNSIAQLKNKRIYKASELLFMRDKLLFRDLDFATDYRVLSLNDPFSNGRTSYFHKSIGGYNGAKLRKYQELISFYLLPEYTKILDLLENNPTNDKIDSLLRTGTPVLNMLNTKYIIYNTSIKPITDPYRFGNAWFVSKVKVVPNADEEILSLKNVDKNTAIIKAKYKDQIPPELKIDTSAKIDLISNKPNHLIYKTTSQYDQIAVFSEIYYPAGWNAYIDGKKTAYFEANYVLRALDIPKGKHTIEFKFEPSTYYLGRKISYAGSGLIFVFITIVILYDIIKRNRE